MCVCTLQFYVPFRGALSFLFHVRCAFTNSRVTIRIVRVYFILVQRMSILPDAVFGIENALSGYLKAVTQQSREQDSDGAFFPFILLASGNCNCNRITWHCKSRQKKNNNALYATRQNVAGTRYILNCRWSSSSSLRINSHFSLIPMRVLLSCPRSDVRSSRMPGFWISGEIKNDVRYIIRRILQLNVSRLACNNIEDD